MAWLPFLKNKSQMDVSRCHGGQEELKRNRQRPRAVAPSNGTTCAHAIWVLLAAPTIRAEHPTNREGS
jgi:hypothetical protein